MVVFVCVCACTMYIYKQMGAGEILSFWLSLDKMVVLVSLC